MLASKLQNNTIESYLIEFNKNTELPIAILNHDINGERSIFIFEGEVTVILDERKN